LIQPKRARPIFATFRVQDQEKNRQLSGAKIPALLHPGVVSVFIAGL
jgi:hypothetical protein